jgi:hypothetical protein
VSAEAAIPASPKHPGGDNHVGRVLLVTSPADARELIARARFVYPRLGPSGFGWPGEIDVTDVQMAADYIRLIGSVRRRRGEEVDSYRMKHEVERFFTQVCSACAGHYVHAGHISNGAFIAAAVGLGCHARTARGDRLNLWFRFSRGARLRLLKSRRLRGCLGDW